MRWGYKRDPLVLREHNGLMVPWAVQQTLATCDIETQLVPWSCATSIKLTMNFENLRNKKCKIPQ